MIDLEELKKQMFFIFYTPGTFGSFLYHILILSDKFTKYFEDSFDIFDQNNAAHKNIIFVLNNFHGDDDINAWIEIKTREDKDSFLNKNIDVKVKNEKIFQPPQRIATFVGINEIREVFPHTNKIFILFKKESLDIVSKIMGDKIKESVNENAIYSYKKISDLEKNKKRKHLILEKNSKKITEYYYNLSESVNIEDTDIVFYFENFFSYDKFLKNLQEILEKFDIQVDKNKVEILYKRFYDINVKYFTYNQSI